ncbi:MAG: cytochrome oxidase putative small subunit CydP [Gammaproteobacteria bacterium]
MLAAKLTSSFKEPVNVGNASRSITGQFRRDIVLVLMLKAAGLYLLWTLFFSAPHQVHPTPGSTAQQLLGASAVSPVQTPRQVP